MFALLLFFFFFLLHCYVVLLCCVCYSTFCGAETNCFSNVLLCDTLLAMLCLSLPFDKSCLSFECVLIMFFGMDSVLLGDIQAQSSFFGPSL